MSTNKINFAKEVIETGNKEEYAIVIRVQDHLDVNMLLTFHLINRLLNRRRCISELDLTEYSKKSMSRY